MKRTAQIVAVEKAQEALARAESDLRAVRRRRKVLCCCGKMHEIGKLELIVTHWYTAPHGCTDGDYWNEGEWRFACPAGGALNRIMFDDYGVEWNRRDIIGVAAEPTFKHIYRGLFASSKNTYERQDPPGYNNHYIDQHRERFELPMAPPRSTR